MRKNIDRNLLTAGAFLFVFLIMASSAAAETGDFLFKFGEPGYFINPGAMDVDHQGNVYFLEANKRKVFIFNADGDFIREFGSQGNEAGQFQSLRDIEVTEAGEIYVYDRDLYNQNRLQVFNLMGEFQWMWIIAGNYYGFTIDEQNGFYYFLGQHEVAKLDHDGTVLETWGSQGTGPGELWYSMDIEVGPAGNIYIIDSLPSLNIFTPYGGIIDKQRPGRMFRPNQLVLDLHGNIYYTDSQIRGVVLLHSDGSYWLEWGRYGRDDCETCFMSPGGIGIDGQGHVYVMDGSHRAVKKFTSTGEFIKQWGNREDQFTWVRDMTLGPDGYLYVLEGSKIKVFTPSGEHVKTLRSYYSNNNALAVDADGFIYVVEGASIAKYDSDGHLRTRWGSYSGSRADGTFMIPMDIAIDSSGHILVLDYWRYDIQVFDSWGGFLGKIGSYGSGDGQFFYPNSFGLDSQGNIYVREEGNHRIQVLDSSGTYIRKWGSEGYEDGQIGLQGSIAVDADGNVYDSEYYGNLYYQEYVRVQVFDEFGGLLTRWGTEGTGDDAWSNKCVAVDPCGRRVYVFDELNSVIKVFEGIVCEEIVDTIPPEVFPPPDITVEAEGGSTAVDIGMATATDDVGVVSLTNNAPDYYPLGTSTITWIATDAAGNQGFGYQNVSVIDTTPPVITQPPNITIEATSSEGQVVNYDVPLATDLIDPDPVVNCFPPPGSTFYVETYPMLCTAYDDWGNMSSVFWTIRIVDTTPPVLVIPPDLVIEATGPETEVVLGEATATDIFEVEVSNDAPAAFPLGDTYVIWQAVDRNGLSAHDVQLVTVLDTTPPNLVVPPDVTVEANGNPNSSVELGTASAYDLVDGEVAATNDAPADGFPLGTTVVTWTAIDSVDNIATAAQQVTVVDTSPPSLTVPADVSVIATGPLTTVNIGTATAEDLFGPVTLSNDSPGAFPVGETVVTWTATDANGNTSSSTQRVMVQYLFGGFLPPVSHGGVYKQGRTIPVKIRATYEDGTLVTGLAPTLTLQLLISGELSGEPLDVESSAAADTGNTFRLADDHYIYNLDTRPISSGMYRLMVDLQDGSGPVHFIDIVLK